MRAYKEGLKLNGDLYLSIVELHRLISLEENREATYQGYFEKNKVVFSALGFDSAESFEKRSKHQLPFDPELGFRPEPDFICGCKSTGQVTIFELKTPFVSAPVTARSDGNRAKLRAELEAYCSQVTEYIESIRGSEAARNGLRKVLGLQRISSYRAQILHGLEKDNAGSLAHSIVAHRNPPIEIVSFDRVRDQLISIYSLSACDTISEEGWTFSTLLELHPDQKSKPSYVFDIGYEKSARLSLMVKERLLVLRIIDENGEAHRLQARFSSSQPVYIRIEVSTSQRNSFINFSVDAENAERRLFQVPIDFRLDISNFVVGADINGLNGAAFDLMNKVVIDRTLSISERIELDVYTMKRYAQQQRIRFDGVAHMKRGSVGLVAPSDDVRPIYIAKD